MNEQTEEKKIEIITDHKWKPFLYFYELTEREKEELDWITDDSMNVFRYRGNVYSIDEFMRFDKHAPFPETWHGYKSDSYFSGILIEISNDGEMYRVGLYLS